MSAWRIKGLLLLTSALGMTALVASGSGAIPERESAGALLDPGVIAAGVCGRSGRMLRPSSRCRWRWPARPRASPLIPPGRRSGRASAR